MVIIKDANFVKNTEILQKISPIFALLVGLVANDIFGAAPGPKSTVSATMDGGTGKGGNTYYEVGVNKAAPTTGLQTGTVSGQTDPASTYLIQPANGLNALMLDVNATVGFLTTQSEGYATLGMIHASIL